MEMDYGHINTFLEKFKKIFKDKNDFKRVVVECLNKNLNFQIKESDILIKPPFVNIKGPPFIKNEILMKKEKILKEIKERVNDIIITEIR